MTQKQLLEEAIKGEKNVFDLIHEYAYEANPFKLQKDSAAYWAFQSGCLRSLSAWLIWQICAKHENKLTSKKEEI